jgi:hypothetical protein
MNDLSHLCARVEVRNVSGQDVAVQAGSSDVSLSLPLRAGAVTTEVKDEAGNVMYFHNDARDSIEKEAWTTDPRTGEMVPAQFLEQPKPPILQLLPGQVLTYEGIPMLGQVDLDAAIRPGTYTVRAIFHYREPPDGQRVAGAVHCVWSEPITVPITQRHINEWRAWVNDRNSDPR